MYTFITTHWELIVAALVVFGVWVARFKAVIQFVSAIFSWFRFISGRATRIEEALSKQGAQIESISLLLNKELKENGGSSIRDIIISTRDTAIIASVRGQSLSNRMEVGIYECDALGRCTFANDAICELFGLSHEEMLGNGWLDAIESTERKTVYDAWSRSVESNVPYSWSYTINNRKTGTAHKCYVRARRITAPAGKLLGFYGTCDLNP